MRDTPLPVNFVGPEPDDSIMIELTNTEAIVIALLFGAFLAACIAAICVVMGYAVGGLL